MSKNIQGIKVILFKSIGFTLIELIIVFTVLSFLSATGIASFVGYSRSQTLSTAASDLVATINYARNNAISQVKPNVNCSSTTLQSYDVYLTIIAPKNVYSLKNNCSNNPIKSYTLPINISFDTASVNKTTISRISYPVLTDKMTLWDTSGNSTVLTGKIVLTGYSQTRTISIDSTNGQTQITNP